jgi:hypothetical protein
MHADWTAILHAVGHWAGNLESMAWAMQIMCHHLQLCQLLAPYKTPGTAQAKL